MQEIFRDRERRTAYVLFEHAAGAKIRSREEKKKGSMMKIPPSRKEDRRVLETNEQRGVHRVAIWMVHVLKTRCPIDDS